MIEPDGPEPVSVVRSTPRSLASLRTGGFARARTSLGSACAAGGTSASAGAAAGAGRWSTAGTGDSSAGIDLVGLGATGRERALHLELGLAAGDRARRGRAAAGAAHRATLGLDPADQGRALHRAGRGRVGQVDRESAGVDLGRGTLAPVLATGLGPPSGPCRGRGRTRSASRRDLALGADRDDRGADGDRLALGHEQASTVPS